MLSLADESFPGYAAVRENFVNYIDELADYQNPDGSWNTVIDDPLSYGEMTATSAFAFAINEGVRLGVIAREYSENAARAIAVLKKNIAGDGSVLNASGGTCIMPSREQYNAVGTNIQNLRRSWPCWP